MAALACCRSSGEALLDHEDEAFAEGRDVGGRGGVERAVDDEEGEAVDGGPGEVFGAGAAAAWEEAVEDHEIERAGEELEGVEAAGARVACDGLGVQECGAEEAGLVEREGEIADADGAEVGAGERGSAATGRNGGYLGLDGAGEL